MTTIDTELTDQVAFIRTRAEASYLRSIPHLPNDAPDDLAAAVHAYDQARENYHAADTECYAAEAVVLNSRDSEAAEIAAAVRTGSDPLAVGNRIEEAQRDLRRAVAVLSVRAGELKQAVGTLLTVAVRHQTAQRAAAQPAIDQAGAELRTALQAVARARTKLSDATDTAAWWTTVGPQNFPSLGRADRQQEATTRGHDFTVLDTAAGTALAHAGLDTGGLL